MPLGRSLMTHWKHLKVKSKINTKMDHGKRDTANRRQDREGERAQAWRAVA